MKNRLLLALAGAFLLAAPAVMTSCSDDDDLVQNVKLEFKESGGVQHEGALYVQNGDTINIESISVVPTEGAPHALITAANYYWDGFNFGPAFAPTFGRGFVVVNQKVGKHTMAVETLIAAEGYSLTTYMSYFPVYVVEDTSSIVPDSTDLFGNPRTTDGEK